MKRLLLLALASLAAPCVLALPGPTAASYAWGAQLTVAGYDASKSTLTNFPVLVRLSPSTVPGFQYSQMVSSSTGADLCFIDMSGNGLPFEIDTWDPQGTSLVWVKLPSMAQGTQFVMCWGSATSGKTVCADNPFAGYKGVWHMDSVDPADSSPNGFNGTHRTANLSVVDGPVGAALNVPRTSDSDGVTCGNVLPNSELTGGFTVEGWCRPTQYGNMGDGAAMFGKNLFVSLRINSATLVTLTTPGKSDHHMDLASGVLPAVNTWWHFAATFKMNTSNGLNFYVNGQLVKTQKAEDINDKSNATELFLGNNQWNQAFKGDLDELRLSAGLRSADWIYATYATQNDAAFLTAGLATPYEATSAPQVGLVVPTIGHTNATFVATVGSLGMDDTMTTDASWVDLLLLVGTSADLSSPLFTVPLDRVMSAPSSVSKVLTGLNYDTAYYAQILATNSFGVAGESAVAAFRTPVPGPVFSARVDTEHLAPDISLSFTDAGWGGSVNRITVQVSTTDSFANPALSKDFAVDLSEMPTNVSDFALTGLPRSSTLYFRFVARNSRNFETTVDLSAPSTIGENNVWSGLSENIADANAYVFAGGLPASDKTLYFTRPAGLSPVIDQDTIMPSLRFTNGQTESADAERFGGWHSCGYDLAGSGVLTFAAEKPILHATKGTNVIENPILFNRDNNQTVNLVASGGRLDLTGELMLPAGVSNTTMCVNNNWQTGELHFGGPSPDFTGKLTLEANLTLFLDHPGAMTNVNQIYFGGGWGSDTSLRNNTGAPMTFPRCETMNGESDWSCTRIHYTGAPFVFPVGTLVWCNRDYGGCTLDADLLVKNLRISLNGSNHNNTWTDSWAVLDKNGNGLLAVANETTWGSGLKHLIRLRGGCFWARTPSAMPPTGEFYVPDNSSRQSTFGLNKDYAPMIDGSSTPRVFQSSSSACWGFTGFGGDRTVRWNGDPTFNLTNTTSGNVSVKIANAVSTNDDRRAYCDYYAYPAYLMFGNRSEFVDGTVIFLNPIRYELGQNWDAKTFFESTNHVVAARMRGSLKLGNQDKTWSFSGRNFGGYLALEAENTDFTGKVNVCEKGNLLVNSNLVARSVTVQSGSGIGGTATLSTEDGTTVKSDGTLFGGEWNKGGTLTLGGKVVLEGGSAIRAEVGASNDRIGMVKLASGSTLKLTAPVYVDVDTDPRVSPVRGAAVKILDWSEATFDSGSAPTRADFVGRPESNSDLETVYVFTRDDGLYVNYVSVRYPPSTIMMIR
ncbi:MAG: hypothetical protein IJL06_04670 [Kiritimatiellae bacterium]|nr:hypothetical protein [Kiritimatiellia bacterium]